MTAVHSSLRGCLGTTHLCDLEYYLKYNKVKYQLEESRTLRQVYIKSHGIYICEMIFLFIIFFII